MTDLTWKDVSEYMHEPDLSDDTIGKATMVHDWRNYVPYKIVELWPYLTRQERLLIAAVAQVQASAEEWD